MVCSCFILEFKGVFGGGRSELNPLSLHELWIRRYKHLKQMRGYGDRSVESVLALRATLMQTVPTPYASSHILAAAKFARKSDMMRNAHFYAQLATKFASCPVEKALAGIA